MKIIASHHFTLYRAFCIRKSSEIATFFTRRHATGIHRTLITFRSESKALLISGVMMSFLITHHQWRGISTSPPSQPPTSPSFAVRLLLSRRGSIIVININASA